jgi:hypothetical protein
VIAPFEKLHENVVSQKCLICELYNSGSQEVKDIILVRHDSTIEKLTQTQTKDKE